MACGSGAAKLPVRRQARMAMAGLTQAVPHFRSPAALPYAVAEAVLALPFTCAPSNAPCNAGLAPPPFHWH